MYNVNVSVLLCQDYEAETQTITRIYNQIETENKEVELCFVTMLNVVGDADEVGLDFYLKCIENSDDLEATIRKRTPLFSLKTKDENHEKKYEYNVKEMVFSQKMQMNFPNKGIYDIQVFFMDEKVMGVTEPNERYKHYQTENILPCSAFRFVVK